MAIVPYLDKVTAFVTRTRGPQTDLLLFHHPSAGVQIPAGSVEEGEPLESAALREVAEETGLRAVSIVRYLGYREELPPNATHVVFRKTRVYSRPDPTSFDWAEYRRGIGVRALRRQGDFLQVTYEENDRYPDPTYLTYQITGWVPESSLAEANRRHFFHLACPPETPDLAEIFTDNHLFRPFWAPLTGLPEIIYPQQAWLDYVTGELGYSLS